VTLELNHADRLHEYELDREAEDRDHERQYARERADRLSDFAAPAARPHQAPPTVVGERLPVPRGFLGGGEK
jgi:hypothetical protein